MKRKSMMVVVAFLTLVSLILSACGKENNASGTSSADSSGTPSGSVTTGEGQNVKVKLGTLPFPDDTVWFIGLEKGWDKELGLDIQTTWFTDDTKSLPSLVRGDIDVAVGAMAPSIVLAAQMPNIVNASLTSMYQAFSVVVRTDEFETYEDLVKKGVSPEQAAVDAIRSLKGKKLVTTQGLFDAPVQSMLTVAGMTMDDLTIINMDQTEGSLAFAQGTGDAYVGGLPSEEKLLSDPKYTSLVMSPQMGPGALFLGGFLTTQKYLEEHRDIVMKLLAMYYRGVNYLNSCPEDALQIMTDTLNKQTGNDWTTDYYRSLVPKKIFFPSYDEALETIYNPEWYGFWEDNLAYFIEANTASGAFGGKKLPDTFMQAPQLFEELKQNKELWDFTNK